MYKYVTSPEQDHLGDWVIDLPCNTDIIESVTADYEDYQITSPTASNPSLNSGVIEEYIEGLKTHTNHLYASGKYIKYIREGNTLKLAKRFQKVTILYRGFVVDEEGLPELTHKEVDAIAAFCAYTNDFKQARMTKDPATFQMAQYMKKEWEKKCTQARIPDHVSQNEMDEILNVSASWDRKRFGKSFKPIR